MSESGEKEITYPKGHGERHREATKEKRVRLISSSVEARETSADSGWSRGAIPLANASGSSAIQRIN